MIRYFNNVNEPATSTTGPSTSTVETKLSFPQEPKKVAKAGELYFRNPKSDPQLIQIEKKKVGYLFWKTF